MLAKPTIPEPLRTDDEAPLITLAELDAAGTGGPACPPWQPGPDASGVYRRPPNMPERRLAAPHDLQDGRWQPRTTLDDAKLAELAASIGEHGVLEDLIALVNEAGQLELITGHRRKRAAIRAGVDLVPVKVVETTAAQARALAIVSNDDRADLTDVERGQAYETIIQEAGISEAELARRLSRPRSYIQQRRALAKAAPEIAAAIAQGTLSIAQARGICAGAPGYHIAQIQALKDIKNRGSWHGPATEQDAQKYAEEAVLSTAKESLQQLGWKVERFYAGDKTLTIVYADTERPRAWTSAEILTALREQKRPGDGPKPAAATIANADWKAIKRRGWEISDRQFAPWVIAKAPRVKFLTADEAPALVEQARKDLDDLKARYVAAGWTLKSRSGDRDDFDATTKEGRKEHLWSWTTATQLIKKIEAGKEPREPNTTVRQCERCKQTKPVSWQQGHYSCTACRDEMEAEEQQARAQLREELSAKVGAWIAAAPAWALRLLVADGEHERLGTRMHMPREQKAPLIRLAKLEALQAALLDDLVDLAYEWRDLDLGHPVAPSQRAVGEEGGEG